MRSLWSDLRYRLRALFRRNAMERELSAELQFHYDHQVAKLIEAGVPAEEATAPGAVRNGRHRSGQRGVPRRTRHLHVRVAAPGPPPRCASAAQRTGIRPRGDPVARARDRGQHRNLHADRHGAAAIAPGGGSLEPAVRRPLSAGDRANARLWLRSPGISPAAGRQPRVHGPGRVRGDSPQREHRRQHGADRRRAPRLRYLFSGPRCPFHHRPDDWSARRRTAQRPPGGGAQLQLLEAPVCRRPVRPRTDGVTVRRPVHDRGRDAARVLRPRGRPRGGDLRSRHDAADRHARIRELARRVDSAGHMADDCWPSPAGRDTAAGGRRGSQPRRPRSLDDEAVDARRGVEAHRRTARRDACGHRPVGAAPAVFPAALHPDDRGRRGPDDRLRERRHADPRPRHGAGPGVLYAPGARCRTLATGAAVARRERRARARRRRRGTPARAVGDDAAGHVHVDRPYADRP